MTIIPTEHEKREWSRMAQAAYSAGHNAIGTRYSMASALCIIGAAMDLTRFDSLQSGYRAWLCFNEFSA